LRVRKNQGKRRDGVKLGRNFGKILPSRAEGINPGARDVIEAASKKPKRAAP
jgi:hypothetical protein